MTIGRVIRELRETKKVSRSELAKDICTIRHLTLIENGERNPSSMLLYMFGERLDDNIIDYYNYIECDHPLQVKYYLDKYFELRRKHELEKLMLLTEETEALCDFKKEPYLSENILNKALYEILVNNNYFKALSMTRKCIANLMGAKYSSDSEWLLRQYFILGLSYLGIGDYINAHLELKKLLSFIDVEKIRNIKEGYEIELYILAKGVEMLLLLKEEEYEEVIKLRQDIIEINVKDCVYELLFYAYVYSSIAFKALGNQGESDKCFKKAVSFVRVFNLDAAVDFLIYHKLMRREGDDYFLN